MRHATRGEETYSSRESRGILVSGHDQQRFFLVVLPYFHL